MAPPAGATRWQRLGRALASGARWALPLSAAVGVAAGVLALRSEPGYRASVALLAIQGSPSYGSSAFVLPPPVSPGIYEVVVDQGPVARQALTTLLGRRPTQAEVATFVRSVRVRVRTLEASSIVTIQTTGRDPALAKRTVETLADALMSWDLRRASSVLSQSIAVLREDIRRTNSALEAGVAASAPLTANARSALIALRRQRASELSTALTRSAASIPVGRLSPLGATVVSPRPVARAASTKGALAAASAFLLCALAILGRAAADPRVRSRRELAGLAGLPVLAEVPARAPAQAHARTEAVNVLRSILLHAAGEEPSFVVGLTTPASADDAQYVSVDLAASLARAGYRVLLVDADLRAPRIARRLGIPRQAATPLQWHLENPRLDATATIVDLGDRRSFDFVPSFAPAAYPQGLLERGLRTRLEAWRQRYAFVLLDAPATLPYADMLTIAPLCGAVLVCADPASLTRNDIMATRTRLLGVAPSLLGLVLTPSSRGRGRRRSRSGAGAQAGSGAGTGAGSRTGGGSRTGNGTGTGAGSRPGSGAGSRTGSQPARRTRTRPPPRSRDD